MKKLFRIITNKFLLTGAAFFIWMVYFDQNNWTAQESRKKELIETEKNITYLNTEIAKLEKEHDELVSNPERLEQYARERYKMKRDNEDVYVIEH